ncbi:hypothetical protein B0T18DRAFT_488480 [Schizothecium vesticola]|uniref:Uncharacterized protein n=1 Tax=Schizothecium vesticola TaxID=314040 RepID=A0AA40EUE3_9PEZI|nr:hypothetical protein B0T18DRAFT_488480 [Schizothecium vesticola]
MLRIRRLIRMTPEEPREMRKEMEEQYERNEPKRRAETAQREAEIARRANLHPTERLAEDGVKLRQEIESKDDMIAVLEVSRSARAGCRASDCFYAPRIHIQDKFRIRVEGVRGQFDPAHRAKQYYHVLCFEAMMDWDKIIPSGKFVCDAGETWGLLVRKWFQHRGRINEKVLVEYVKEREEWDMKHYGGFSRALIRALFADTERRGADDGAEGIASSSASVPETTVASRKEDGSPVLREYVMNEGWVSLFLLLQLPEIEGGRMQFMQDPRRPFVLQAVDPWPDANERVGAEEYGPKTEEEGGED